MNESIKSAGLAFAGLLILGACAMSFSAIAQQDGLKSCEDFIHRFVEKNGFYQSSAPNGEFLSERDHIAFDGCKVTLHVLTVGADEPPYKRESVNFDTLFNLKNMDPEVAASPKDLNGNTLPDSREWVILRTADRNESILMRRGGALVSSSSVLPLQGGANHQETQKLADAFSHAIAICRQER
jgi:hypothetical protein